MNQAAMSGRYLEINRFFTAGYCDACSHNNASWFTKNDRAKMALDANLLCIRASHSHKHRHCVALKKVERK